MGIGGEVVTGSMLSLRLSRQCGAKSIIDYIPKRVGYGADQKLLCFHQNQPCA